MDELLKKLRLLKADHAPDGWPAVQMRDISAVLDYAETLRQQLTEAQAALQNLGITPEEAKAGLERHKAREQFILELLAAIKAKDRALIHMLENHPLAKHHRCILDAMDLQPNAAALLLHEAKIFDDVSHRISKDMVPNHEYVVAFANVAKALRKKAEKLKGGAA